MNTNIEPIHDLKELPDHLNTAAVISMLREMNTNTANIVSMLRAINIRLDKMDAVLKVPTSFKPKKEWTRVRNFEPYIYEVLTNGRSWSYHSVYEELKEKHPELPPFKVNGVQSSLNRMWHEGLIERVTHGVYKKKG